MGDEDEFSEDTSPALKNRTRAGRSMHDKSVNKRVMSRDLDEVKDQLNTLSKMLGDFKKDNDQVKNELKDLKRKMNSKNMGKLSSPKVLFNENNKRVKPDTSSSENENNDLILSLKAKVEKQDNLLNNMFSMINKISE